MKQIIKDIFDLAFEISEVSDLNVCVEFIPYVKGVDVRVFNHSHEGNTQTSYRETMYYSDHFKGTDKGDLHSIKSYLSNLLIETKEVEAITYE